MIRFLFNALLLAKLPLYHDRHSSGAELGILSPWGLFASYLVPLCQHFGSIVRLRGVLYKWMRPRSPQVTAIC